MHEPGTRTFPFVNGSRMALHSIQSSTERLGAGDCFPVIEVTTNIHQMPNVRMHGVVPPPL